jgi:hypothetical protein
VARVRVFTAEGEDSGARCTRGRERPRGVKLGLGHGSSLGAPVVERRGHGGGCGRAVEAGLHGAGTGAGAVALWHDVGAVVATSRGARRRWHDGSEREARSR